MAPDSIKGPLGIDERRMLVFAHQCGGPDEEAAGIPLLQKYVLLLFVQKDVQVQLPQVPIGPFSRFPHERTWRQPGKLYSARKSPGGRAAACWQNKGQGQGHGPPMPSLLRYGAVLGQVMFQIAGFESHGSSQSHIIDNLG
ncbi:hypothetical protein OOU_Y34scaffold00666g126 [Pyricularia oryzae Y34]|uniref:Uncharacterized protein n=1 Tax=Pyricularia oryzae (strain Y34) TaxID=1143189 RepID=A0AA97NTW4_PYRO3|nr:hypothetical protein OOU_Y34scaffold00666g126 [Pyricularia oryzae Y34]